MEVERLRQGLWRWTAPHPEWDPGGTGASAWPQMVGSVYYEAPEATVLIDPLVPSDPSDAARFWIALDRDVERRGLPVATLRTVHWHERSCAQIRARYPAYAGHPPSVAAIALGDPIGETHFHLAEHRALVPGDVLLGASGAASGCVRPPGTAAPTTSAPGTANACAPRSSRCSISTSHRCSARTGSRC